MASGPSTETEEEETINPTTQFVQNTVNIPGVPNTTRVPASAKAASPEEAIKDLLANKVLPAAADLLVAQMSKPDVKPIIKPRYNMAPTSGSFYLPVKAPQEEVPLAEQIKKKLKKRPPAEEPEDLKDEELGIIDAKER